MPGPNAPYTTLDEQQVVQSVFDITNDALRVNDINSAMGVLVPEEYDYIGITYVAAGDGMGEIETVTYKTGGAGGTTVALLTLTYNIDDKLATVTRT